MKELEKDWESSTIFVYNYLRVGLSILKLLGGEIVNNLI